MNLDKATASDARDPETRQIQRIACYGFLLNLGLAVMKGWLVVISGSLAITASAIDSATDAVASVFLLTGLRLSTRKTAAFPLGLYKIENLLSVILALLIFFAGYELARRAFSSSAIPPDISLTVLLLMAAATIVIAAFGRYAFLIGQKTGSPTLIAEGRHRQADAFASMVVLVSVILSYFKLEFGIYGITIDQIAAVLVLVFIAHTGWELLSGGMRVLLDASIDYDTLDSIRKIIEAEPLVKEVNNLVGRNAGRFRFLQVVITVKTDDLKKAHQLSERIETRIRQNVRHVEHVVIHYEPQRRDFRRLAVPLADTDGNLSAHFGEAPYFALVVLRTEENQIEQQDIRRNPHTKVTKAKGIQVAKWLVDHKVDVLAVKHEIKAGPGYVLSNAGVTIQQTSASDLRTAIETLAENTKSL